MSRISPKLPQVENMIGEIDLQSVVTIKWVLLNLSFGQGKLHPASVANWP